MCTVRDHALHGTLSSPSHHAKGDLGDAVATTWLASTADRSRAGVVADRADDLAPPAANFNQ